MVEYLTSEDAGKELGNSFAWPVGLILGGGSENGCVKKEVDGVGVNGHVYANGTANVNAKTNGKLGADEKIYARKKSD